VRTSTRCTRNFGHFASASALRSRSVIRAAVVHERVSVHNVTFFGTSLPELHSHWQAIGLKPLSLLDSQLFEPQLAQIIDAGGYSVETVCHVFASRDELSRVVDAAADVRARVIYMLTGGRGGLSWEQAADRFCESIQPCIHQAR